MVSYSNLNGEGKQLIIKELAKPNKFGLEQILAQEAAFKKGDLEAIRAVLGPDAKPKDVVKRLKEFKKIKQSYVKMIVDAYALPEGSAELILDNIAAYQPLLASLRMPFYDGIPASARAQIADAQITDYINMQKMRYGLNDDNN